MRIYVHDSETRRVVEADGDALLADVVSADGSAVWAEDAQVPLSSDAKVSELAALDVAAVHVGKGHIKVTASYNGITASESFGPGTKIEKVLDWALSYQGFAIPAGDRDDLVLRLSSNTDPLDPDTHIGTLASKGDTLALDLVPGERFAG